MKQTSIRIGIVVLFVAIFFALFPGRMSMPAESLFLDDAREYHQGAMHLVEDHFYSLDGEEPFVEREPGYSFFLASLYFFFGTSSRAAIFIAQALLYLCAAILFSRTARGLIGERGATIFLGFLLLSPPVFHTIFSAYRESITLSLLLLFAAAFLRFQRSPALLSALGLGLFWSIITLTYYPLLLLPIPLGIVLFFTKMPKKHILLFMILSFVLPAVWGYRNMQHTDRFQIVGTLRTTYVWHARGEQAEKLRGFEPMRCMWSEYISRNWDERSDACSFLGIVHRTWPNGQPTGNEEALSSAGKKKIVQYLPHYLWFTAFEVLELHLPYVNGWGFVYNLLAIVSTLLIYFGMILGFRFVWRREFLFFAVLMVYQIGIFSLTEAIPRYLIPALFCYMFFAAIGYDRVLHWWCHR